MILLGLGGELFSNQPFDQGDIEQIAFSLFGKEIALDCAAGGEVGIGADEEGALVIRGDGFFGQHPADLFGAVVPGIAGAENFEDLFLARVIIGDAIAHQLFEGQLAVFEGFEDNRAGIGKAQTLPDHKDGGAEGGGDGVFAVTVVGHGLERPEFVKRGQRLALRVLGETVGLGETVCLDDAGDGRVPGQLLLLDEELERAETAAASLDGVGAGFLMIGVEDGADAQRLEKAAKRDVGGEVLNAGVVDWGFAYIGGVDVELVEGNGDGRGERKFRGLGLGHGRVLLAWVPGLPGNLSLAPALRPSLPILFL